MRSATPEPVSRNRWFSLPASWPALLVLAGVLTGLCLLSQVNFLLFHALVELFAAAVAGGAFMVAWNSRRFLENGCFLVIGAASLGVAILDILHLLAYKNMGVFPGADANLPTQLWIAGRWLQVGALFAAPFFLARRPQPRRTLAACCAVTALFVAAIFWWRIFPACFVEGAGLTPFKLASEYLFILLLAGAIVQLRRHRQGFDRQVLALLTAACAAFLLAELAFTLYTDVFGITNMAGHLFKVVGCYAIYRATIETALARPFDLLFREVTQSETALRQRTLELETVNARLEEANRDLEAFNYSVSHDLRSPLTVIDGRCQLIQECYGEHLPAELQGLLEGVHLEARRMSELITTLLDFARLGTVELRRQAVDASRLSQTIACRLQLREPERAVEFDIAPGGEVHADPRLVEIALENLLGNAWKFTAGVARPRIAFGAAAIAGERAFFVRDNGIGFDMGRADELFEPFRRLHSVMECPGFGIGLATVQRIVARHGGRVWAESAPGAGATFYFTL